MQREGGARGRELLAEDGDHDQGVLDRPIIPAIGAIQVARLTPADLDCLYRHLLKVGGPNGPYALGTIRRIRRIHGIVPREPTQGVRRGAVSRSAGPCVLYLSPSTVKLLVRVSNA